MRRLCAAALLGALAALCAPAAALAAPVLDLEIHHEPSHFSPPFAGSASAKTIVEGSASPPVNEVQAVTVQADEGSFVLSFEGESTPELAAGASRGAVRNALRALPAIGSPNVDVEREAEGPTRTYTIEFVEALAATPVGQVEVAEGSEALTVVPEATYSFDLRNTGPESTSGTVALTLRLPEGLSYLSGGGSFRLSNGWKEVNGGNPNVPWDCSGNSPGDTTVACAIEAGFIPRHTVNDALTVRVAVDPAAAGSEPSATATATGGGAPNTAGASEPTRIDYAPAPFGILPSSFVPRFDSARLGPSGYEPERRSGAHPTELTIPLEFDSVPDPAGSGSVPAANIRDATVDLPPGFLGNPTAVGECSQALFTLGECPGSAQVGRVDAKVTGFPPEKVRIGIFNLRHPLGVVSDIAFAIAANPVHIKASLDPANRYAIATTTAEINETLPVLHTRLTFWGTPADPSHDSERCQSFKRNVYPADYQNGDTSGECQTDHARQPFLTMPSQCGVAHTIRLRDYDSWQDPGAFGPELDRALPASTDCDVPRFDPSAAIEPTGREANTPTGLEVRVHVPQNENPDALATPPVKSTVVTLPEGMTVNPAFADGLTGCTEAQFGISHSGVPNSDAVGCPDNSRIGEVQLKTPLLPQAAEGSMYLASQEDNPFGSLLAFYLALHDTEERGVLVKLAGRVSLDPASGQITTSFDELPQLPFEDLTLKFRSGPRAPLVNPPACGAQRIAVKLASYARPGSPADASSSYQVSQGPGGAPCPPAGARPFAPTLAAGTLNPVAGTYSPLALRVTRTDADQEIAAVAGSAPPGLVASLRGVPFCPEAQIAVARSRSAAGEGQLERRSPSCPAASLIGTVSAGAGAGPEPIYVPGRLYLAGPYKGAPLSGVAVVPAIAGPVDLGTIVVRAPAYLNPRTAQIRIASDPLPQVVHGVLVRARDLRITLDRPNFTLNPTSCDPMSFAALLSGTEGALAPLAQRFQVGDCRALGFKPRLGLRLRGGTKRGKFPKLRATYVPKPGGANLRRLALRFPRSEFIEQGHFRTICTRVAYAAGGGMGAGCPQGSVYGRARVFTPLLDRPLAGPVYLRSSSHKLPDAVFALHGTIDAEVVVRIDSVRGGLRATIEGSPDVPVSRAVVVMQGGQKGLFVNSTNICRGTHRAKVRLAAHSNRRAKLGPRLRPRCGKGHGKKGKGKRR